ncbi:MAG: GNAT family N-acetyltransferase [Rhodanobacteraceae bacterium]
MTTTLRISTDPRELDVDMIHGFLSTDAYWSRGIPHAVVERSIAGSLCFGGYLGDRQIAFARAVTDCATFAWLADVFVLPEFRGRGYSKALVKAVVEHPRLQGLRRFTLATRDAHGLYAQFGFKAPEMPQSLLEIRVDDAYRAARVA